MNNKVSVVKCDRYSEVQNAVENAVSLIGGIGKFVKKGDNVVIKPNLVSKKKPEEAVTTNPEFLPRGYSDGRKSRRKRDDCRKSRRSV